MNEALEEHNCTITDDESVKLLYQAVFHYVFPVLIVTGIATNALNLIVLTRPLMRGRTYRWLRALAFVDLSLCVLTVPVCLASGGISPFSSRSLAYYYAHFGWSLSIAAQILSFYLMGMFAFERFLAVCRHDLYPRSQTDKVFRRGVASAAFVVLLVYMPTIGVGDVNKVGDHWCSTDGYSKQEQEYGWYPVYAWIRELFSRLLPAVAITFCNVRITLRLRHLRNIREGFSKGVSATRRERERRLVMLLFCFTALFFIFNAPVTVYYLGYLHTSRYRYLKFAAISNLLQMMGNVSNFVLYFLISPEFHNTLCNLLTCKSTDLSAGRKAGSMRTSKAASAPPAITSSASNANFVADAAVELADDESPTQSDSGYQHDVADNAASPRGSSCSSGDESHEAGNWGHA